MAVVECAEPIRGIGREGGAGSRCSGESGWHEGSIVSLGRVDGGQ